MTHGAFMLTVAIAGYIVAIVLAFLYREHHRVHHANRFECVGCSNRRRIVRVAVVAIVGALILWEGDIHAPDLGFIALAILVELT